MTGGADEHEAVGRFSHHQVGSVRVTTVTDGFRRFALPDQWILNAARDEIDAALVAAGLPPGEITNPYNPVVLSSRASCTLIDTGVGPQPHGSSSGKLGDSLAAAGIARTDIGTVIISHCHGDHVLGLLDAVGGSAFSRARILVSGPEWRFWMDDALMSQAGTGRMAELFAVNRRVLGAVAGQVTLYEWGEELVQGLTAIATPGHSVGHTSFLLRSEGQRMFIQSDLTHVPALFMPHPGWHAAYDQDPTMAEAVRRRMLGMLASGRTLVQGFHFPFPSRGFVERDGHGFRFKPQS